MTETSGSNLQLDYQRLLALERFKSGFLARTSHELRSPINTIVSLHQLILEDLCEGPEEEKEFIAQSKAAALKMLALFDQVAAVAKLDIGRVSPALEAVDLSFLLPEVEMLTTLQATNQNVRYTVETPSDEIEISTDGKWLKNILISLIQDAIPHTKKLHLSVEQKAQAVAIVIECDRPATALQTELDNISDMTLITADSRATLSHQLPTTTENLQLSTGLILATAQIALPVIQGEFSIAPLLNEDGDDSGRSYLRCTFS